MKKVIVLVMLLAIVLQTAAFAQAEFMYGEASVAEKVKIDSEEFKLHARIYNINGVPYVYNKFDVATNPVPYDENLKAIIGKEYIITDDYYLAFDVEKTGAISAGAYVAYTRFRRRCKYRKSRILRRCDLLRICRKIDRSFRERKILLREKL